jgi:hypothetical protein
MPAYRDKKTGSWYVNFYYLNWKGTSEKKLKRGFKTKKEALAWEAEFKDKQSSNMDMNFGSFVELYYENVLSRIKRNTFLTKRFIIENKILPVFKDKKMNEIKVSDIIAWQNSLLLYRDEKGKPYSSVYLKTIHNQLSAIFNHAVKFYDLKSNPPPKREIWGRREGRRCFFGQRKSISNSRTA